MQLFGFEICSRNFLNGAYVRNHSIAQGGPLVNRVLCESPVYQSCCDNFNLVLDGPYWLNCGKRKATGDGVWLVVQILFNTRELKSLTFALICLRCDMILQRKAVV